MNKDLRIAWLVPAVELGAYWQPVLREFTKVFKNTVFYTGLVWPGFDPSLPGCDVIQLVGKTKYLETTKIKDGYDRGVFILSPSIVGYLLSFKPDLIFAQAYSLWTLLAVLFMPIGRWKLIIIYDGSSPNADFRDSVFRTFVRRILSRFACAFVSNSKAGTAYLQEALSVPPDKIFTRIYLVPDAQALLGRLESSEPINLALNHPIFLYVGRITSRKGITTLLQACAILNEKGYKNYNLLLVGEGDQRQELEAFIKENDFEDQVTWAGWVEYGRLGAYFSQADVFVFPTYEDVWGMVAPEAMVFGLPILCSKGAACCELIEEGKNGYIFDPRDPQALAETMQRLLDDPELIASMGERSQQIISRSTPQTAAQAFVEATSFVFD
ncbi:glycosyltransferase family 4 protein [Ancylothrix sp. C2]|uniref:glycosyltransferase family 4 protein n=1 Tax=Ancylothrix sp. D3o TaxID=2953691 RepID=UPI0021BBA7BB|nr:glycosyltransferase family 4 protein [Ancylothrix sp. D3o]MCT7952755.1 glycosyltransferase family 4 protein [Ancylothrix sp. D3o]